jgi:dolichyl-phosphate-mannose--protein O-mannosyl transferase
MQLLGDKSTLYIRVTGWFIAFFNIILVPFCIAVYIFVFCVLVFGFVKCDYSYFPAVP